MAQWTDRSRAARARDARKCICRAATETRLSSLKNRFYTAVPVIRQDIMAALKNKGIYLLDPESANGYSVVAAIAILVPFGILQYLGWAELLRTRPSADVVCVILAAVIWWLFARVMTAKTVKGATHPGRGAWVPGIHESRGCGPAEAACRRQRSKSFCLTPWRWAWSITGRRRLPESSKIRRVVRGAGRLCRRLQSDFLFEFDAQHGDRHAPGFRVSPARQFVRLGLWRRGFGGGGGFSGGGFGGGGGGAF